MLSFVRVKNDTPELDMDIFQEAMMTAYVEVERGRYQPRDGIPFAAYVKGIAWNKIREARRRTRRFVPLDDAEHIDADIELPAETIERKERHTSLRTGLAKLTAGRRQVLESYLKGHTTAEIARALDMSEDSVRQHKCRGLRSLRRNLKEMDVLAPRC